MKLMKMTLFAVAGGLAANYLLKKNGSSAGGRQQWSGASEDGVDASSASLSSASGGSGARSQRLSSRSPTAMGAESPNAAERLLAARPDDSLAGSRGGSLDPLRSNSRDGEFATSTGLSDFARGA